MKFNKEKCKVLHLEWNGPMHQRRLESNLAEEDLGVLVDAKWIISQQCALMAKKATSILCSILAGKHDQQVEGGNPSSMQHW